MTKVANEPRKKYTYEHKFDRDYKVLLAFFVSKIEHSNNISETTTYLFKSGFRLEHWERFCMLIKQDPLPFGLLVEKLIGKRAGNIAMNSLLFFGVCIIPEMMRNYFKVQICACYKDEFLYRGLALDHYFGFEYDKQKASWLLNGNSARLLPIKTMLREIIDEYWNADDKCYMARHDGGLVKVRYLGKEVALTTFGTKPQECNIVLSFKKLRLLVEDVCNEDLTIRLVQTRHNIYSANILKLYVAFNPSKLLKEARWAFWEQIKANIPINNINQIMSKVFESAIEPESNYYNNNIVKRAVSWLKLMAVHFHDELKSLSLKMVMVQKRVYNYVNFMQLKSRDERVVFTYITNKGVAYTSVTAKFAHFPIYLEWAEFMNSLKPKQRRVTYLDGFLNYLATERHYGRKTLYAEDITKDDLRAYLDSGISNEAAKRTLAEYRNFVAFLQKLKQDAIVPIMGIISQPPKNDISRGFSVNKNLNRGNYQPLPEDVYTKIMYHIDEVEPTCKNAFILSAATGMRPNEWEGITAESMVTENLATTLSVWQFKQEKAYAKRGKKPIREVPITDPKAIKAFKSQVKESKEAREIVGSKSIFSMKLSQSTNDIRYGILTSNKLNSAINSLIVKHNICGENGKLWRYSSYQLRTSMVVEMVEAGATDKELKSFFGWFAQETMKQAYVMARKMKLADMNSEFFREEFGVNLPQSKIDQYTEDELQMMAAEFLMNSRDMGYGKCLRHPVQGECGKLHEARACAPCVRLIVDHTYRERWEELYSKQYSVLVKLRRFYEDRGQFSERYETFAYYIKEMGVLESYASVLMNIDKRVKVVKWYE